MDKKQVTAMVLLDFSKAFDSIGHTIPLKKLQGLGISQTGLQWFTSYLSQRQQQVRIGKSLSISKTVTHGVPEGSILGPLLFNLYIHDLFTVCNGSEIDSFVDDTKLYAALKLTDLVRGLDCLMTDLNKVAGMVCYNQLLINPEKTQYILFVTRPLLQRRPPDLNQPFLGKDLFPAKSVKDLGVILDKHLSYDEHMSKIVSSCNLKLKQISRVKYLFDEKTLIFIIQSVVFGRLFKSIKNLASNQLHLKVMSCQLTKRDYKLRNDEDLRPPRYKTTTVHLSIEHVRYGTLSMKLRDNVKMLLFLK